MVFRLPPGPIFKRAGDLVLFGRALSNVCFFSFFFYFAMTYAAPLQASEFPRLSYEISLSMGTERTRVNIRGAISALARGRYRFNAIDAYGAADNLALIREPRFHSGGKNPAIVEAENGNWTIEHAGGRLQFDYDLRMDSEAHGLTMMDPGFDEMPHADDSLLFLLGELVLVHPEGVDIEKGIELRWNLPQGWSAFTPWSETLVPDMDSLLNNYMIAARDTRPTTGHVGEFSYRLVWPGRSESVFSESSQRQINQAFKTAIEMFGGLAVRPRYLIVIKDVFPQGAFAGSPKQDSIQLSVPEGIGGDELTDFNEHVFYRVLIHEFFHTWTNQVFTDAGLLSSPESASELYWLAEGFNDYLAMLALAKAGILSPQEFISMIYQRLVQQTAQAQEAMSLLEASKQFFANTYARERSYELGLLLALDLDLRLRALTEGKRTVAGFVHYLIAQGGVSPAQPEAVEAAWRAFVPQSLENALTEGIHAANPIDPETLVGMIKAEQRLTGHQIAYDAALEKTEQGLCFVFVGNEAADQGLQVGDCISSVDGHEISAADGFYAALSPDKPTELKISRAGRMIDLHVKPNTVPVYEWSIQADSPLYALIGLDPRSAED